MGPIAIVTIGHISHMVGRGEVLFSQKKTKKQKKNKTYITYGLWSLKNIIKQYFNIYYMLNSNDDIALLVFLVTMGRI